MTEETHKTNPARRLLEILSKTKKVPAHGEHGGAITVREAWCFVFDILQPNSEAALLTVLSRMVALRELFHKTENALRAIKGINEGLFIKPIAALSRIVNFNTLTDSWGTYTKYLNVEDMTRLEYAEHLLAESQTVDENEIPNEELKELLVEVDGLIESVMDSSLPISLKTSLLELLHDIRKAIFEYRIRGAVILKEALAKSVGVLAVNKEDLDQNKDSEEIQQLGRMLIRIDKMYTFAMKMKPLLEAAANILPALASHVK